MTSQIYFKQLLVGRDIAQDNTYAQSMGNYVYLLGDLEKQECFVIDPAWDIKNIIKISHKDNMKITGALVTHYHPDHIGGDIFGISIQGLPELLAQNPVKIHAHILETPGIIQVTNISLSDIISHHHGDKIKIGNIQIEILHTPGHTPGSICFRVQNSLLSGDTLFLRGCGRVDLPGGDVNEMYRTIHERLDKLDNKIIIYPGHNYDGTHENLEKIKQNNPIFKFANLSNFKRFFLG